MYELAIWVCNQRREYRLLQERRHPQLTDERVKKLNDIGFFWDIKEAKWETCSKELKKFKNDHGHTEPPTTWDNQGLLIWVRLQRKEYINFMGGKRTFLTKERIQRLDEYWISLEGDQCI